jgi:hypothetical protein
MPPDTPAAAAPLAYPAELTPALRDVLSLMVFHTGPMAELLRKRHAWDIPRKAEEEQAVVLHWLITLVLRYGDKWRDAAAPMLGIKQPQEPCRGTT